MFTCPACGFERNIDGADLCEVCQTPLSEIGKPRRRSSTERHMRHDPIALLEPRMPIITSPYTPVSEVLAQLVKHGVGCVLVVEHDELLGIFTERDALMRVNADVDALADHPIAAFMTPAPQTLDGNDKIAFALSKMDVGGYRHIPVLTAGRLTGVISIRDVLRYLSDHALAG